MDKQEAIVEAKVQEKQQGNKWCPLCGSNCRIDCVVYIKSKVVSNSRVDNNSEYEVKPGYCNAYSLVGL